MLISPPLAVLYTIIVFILIYFIVKIIAQFLAMFSIKKIQNIKDAEEWLFNHTSIEIYQEKLNIKSVHKKLVFAEHLFHFTIFCAPIFNIFVYEIEVKMILLQSLPAFLLFFFGISYYKKEIIGKYCLEKCQMMQV